jgi:hypothetical protein
MGRIRYRGTGIVVGLMLLIGAHIAAFGDEAAGPQAATGRYDFTVVSAPKDRSHPHYGEGSPVAFVVNGVQGRSLVLVRGRTYTFLVNTGPMHDFYLSTDPRGWGAGTVTAGVEGNFTYKGLVSFRPSAETPDLIYYQCRNHQYMGGAIHIVNPGEEATVKSDGPMVSPASRTESGRPALAESEVKQRLYFADVFISQSESAKRIAASNNEDAKSKYGGAQSRLADAKKSFESRDLQATMANCEAALLLMKEAAQEVPSQSAQEQAKARYAELAQGVIELEASYRRNREAVVGKSGAKNIAVLDSDKIRSTLDSAKALADGGKYDEANGILSDAMNQVSAALTKLLAHRTISYEMKFTSPAEEYDYELARFRSFEELIPLAREKMHPAPETLAQADAQVFAAKANRKQAAAEAGRQDFAAALENIKEGTDQLKAALAVLGVK